MARRTDRDHRGDQMADGVMEDVAANATSPGNVDKIRDILFGREIREYDRRFARLEEQLQRAVQDVRQELDGRISTLEAHVRDEMATLTERIRTERTDRSDALSGFERELETTSRSLRSRLTELTDRLADTDQTLRARLLELAQSAREDLRRQGIEFTARLDAAASGLGNRKVDRAALASLLSEVALRLSGELDVNLASLADD